MKTFFTTLVFLLVFISGHAQLQISAKPTSEKSEVTSQTQSEQAYNFVVLTRNTQQLKPILMAAEDLSKENGEQFDEFYVIVCGKAVKDLSNPKTMEHFIKDAQRLGVQLMSCGFSLKKFGVNEEKLPEGIKVIENGIQFNLELQKQGYINLSL